MGAHQPRLGQLADRVITRGFAQQLTLTRPGPSTERDADDTVDLPGEPVVAQVRGDVWALGVEQQVLEGDVVVADYACVVPPGTVIDSSTVVVDDAGATFTVYGRPEPRRSLRTGRPDHIEARLKFISDTQGDPP